ncbi:MAG: protein kinase [Archangium sp.]|nr:protein kinase [Archangium sp.]
MADCLSMETILALVEGGLPESQAAVARAHLAGCDDCRRRVALAAGPAPEPRLSPTLSPVPMRTSVPSSVGRYRIIRELGRGAMGVVLLAEDTLLARQVALKAVGPSSADGELAQHVSSEARAIARLQHPNVVGLFDVLQQAGQVYLAMEFVEGGDLQRWLVTPRTHEEIVELFLQAAAGLEAAHDSGVVHRDFKPANVLVGTDGRARVSDFGLATMQGERDSVVRGSVVGTPAYMAPEQFAGKLAGAAADQFSFCAALFEALAGQRPFVGEDMLTLRESVMKGPPLVPGSVAPQLAAVLRRGLATEPKDRFPSMRDVTLALRAANGARGRRRQVIGLGAAALVTVVVLGAALRPADPCRVDVTRLSKVWPAPDAASVPATVRTSLEQTARAWSEAYGEQCHQWVEKKISDSEWQRTRGCLEAALDDVESVAAAAKLAGEAKPSSLLLQYVAQPRACAAPGNPPRSGLPVERIARQKVTDTLAALVDVAVLDQATDVQGALRKATEAVELAITSNHPPTHARALLVQARLQYNSGLRSECMRSLERAVSVAQSSGALREVARAELQLAFDVCIIGGSECLPRLERVRTLVDTLDDAWLRAYLDELSADADWRRPATLEMLGAVVAGWKKLPGAATELARSQRRLARALVDSGDFDAGVALTFELLPQKTPLTDLRGGEVVVTRGLGLAGQGRVDEALRLFEYVQLMAERQKLPAMQLDALNNRVQVLLDEHRSAEALALLAPDSGSSMLQEKRVRALLNLGRFPEAKAALDALTFPPLLPTLDDYVLPRVRYLQVLLALELKDTKVLERIDELMGPGTDPALLAAALTTRGLETEARKLLASQPESYWMGHVELAQREHRWADALALLDQHQAELNVDNRLEADLRRDYTELMLGRAPAEACARLSKHRLEWKQRWFSLFPNERLRLDAALGSRCR